MSELMDKLRTGVKEMEEHHRRERLIARTFNRVCEDFKLPFSSFEYIRNNKPAIADLVAIYKILSKKFEDVNDLRNWLAFEHPMLNKTPYSLLSTVTGLEELRHYLEKNIYVG